MTAVRINRYLAQAGLCSRRQADDLIERGKVTINGLIAALGDPVAAGDEVRVNGKPVAAHSEPVCLIFNKPVGVICTTDSRAANNIMSYINIPQRVFPVGRLDVGSCGLILLTNDGALAHRVLKGKQVEKEYLVELDKPVTAQFLASIARGLVLDGIPTLAAHARQLAGKRLSIVLVEGRQRQVRRMCALLGYRVVRLQRIRIGNIRLGDLKEGQFRRLPPGRIRPLLGL